MLLPEDLEQGEQEEAVVKDDEGGEQPVEDAPQALAVRAVIEFPRPQCTYFM